MKTLQLALFLGLAVLCVSQSSCKKKKGCTTLGSHNWDPEAKKDDGSCLTCFDGIKNGDEVATDCGGKCHKSCWATLQGSPTVENLYSVHFLDKNTGWISGANGTLFKTTNAGASWTNLSLTTSARIEHVFFVDQNDGWATATDYIADSSHLMHTLDGGASWDNVLSGGYYDFSDVEFVTSSIGYAIAQYGILSSMQESIVFKTTDGGSSWETDTLPNTALVSLFAVNASKVWLSGDNGAIYSTSDGGVTWNSKGGATWVLMSDIFVYGNTGVAVGWEANAISHSSNGGSDWSMDNVWDVQQYHSVYAINENEYYAVATYPSNFELGAIMYSKDGGASWVHHYAESQTVGVQLHDVYFADATHGWTVGFNGAIIRMGY